MSKRHNEIPNAHPERSFLWIKVKSRPAAKNPHGATVEVNLVAKRSDDQFFFVRLAVGDGEEFTQKNLQIDYWNAMMTLSTFEHCNCILHHDCSYHRDFVYTQGEPS